MLLTVLRLATRALQNKVENDPKWMRNPDPTVCPRCKTPAPKARIPKSVKQAIDMTYTCKNCGCDYDRWSKELAS